MIMNSHFVPARALLIILINTYNLKKVRLIRHFVRLAISRYSVSWLVSQLISG
jgi:hypothetical protein